MEVHMKRFYVAAVFALTALVTLAPSAHAFGIMGCWWNMKDQSEDGWGGGLRQQIPLIPPKGSDSEDALVRLSLDTRASYFRFSDAELNVIPLEIGGMAQLALIYAELGGGYYIFDADHYDVDNAWGWYILGGVNIGRGAKGLFAEVKWTSLTADIKNVDVDLGDVPNSINADGVGINVGINFGI
jgi:hypothetical protein